MKIFAVTLEFELSQKPNWLDSFRKKYDEPYHYHITLKNPTFIEENQVENLKKEIGAIVSHYQSTGVIFNSYVIDNTPKGEVIMVQAEPNSTLFNLQNEIHIKLLHFGSHTKDYYLEYETNFKPHITIARKLDNGKLAEAMAELPPEIFCQAKIERVTLCVVDNDVVEEANDEKNRTYFDLQQK